MLQRTYAAEQKCAKKNSTNVRIKASSMTKAANGFVNYKFGIHQQNISLRMFVLPIWGKLKRAQTRSQMRLITFSRRKKKPHKMCAIFEVFRRNTPNMKYKKINSQEIFMNTMKKKMGNNNGKNNDQKSSQMKAM